MPRQPKTRPSHLDVAERRAHVFQLRRTGASYAVIYSTMRQDAAWKDRLPKSYDERHVHGDVLAEIARMDSMLAEDVEAVRRLEIERLDRMLLGVWPRAQAGDDHAIQSVLALMARRARYVPSLEVPTNLKVDTTVEAGAGMAALLSDLATLGHPPTPPPGDLPPPERSPHT
jgi:hypothetical protein